MRANRTTLLAGVVLSLVTALAPQAAAAPDPVECLPDGRMKSATCEAVDAAAVADGYGWVWAHDPSHLVGEWYIPSTPYQYSSVTDSPSNQVRHVGLGTYTVFVNGVSPTAGVTHVTAYGRDSRTRCKVIVATPTVGGQYLTVRCYDFGGTPVDGMFTASFTNLRSRDYPFGYRAVNNGVVTTHNSASTTVIHAREALGQYKVSFKQLGGSAGGTVQVTATGQSDTWCKTADWYPDSIYHHVLVRCFTPSGAPADSDFNVTFVNKGNIVGDKNPTPGLTSAYGWISSGASASAPDTWAYPLPTWTVATPTTGTRDLTPSVTLASGGEVQVTAYDTTTNSCVIAYWTGTTATVQCYTTAGAPVNGSFDISYLGKRTWS
ncbi:MAG: hypothetical protein ABIQ18_16460 [Umezawaea sp.]